MQKTLLVTGATDGIGLEAAKRLAAAGHTLLLHGRSQEKLEQAVKLVTEHGVDARVSAFRADLSRLSDVESLATQVTEKHQRLDALINNAGVLNTDHPQNETGLDVRFVVNTIAPYLLTKRLLPLLGTSGRVVNVSSAAQAPVEPKALSGDLQLDDMEAYSQSKL
ncbi:MAG: SDR family NAD(P)-dependent oxidoreductase, partial [Gammaproteobacteria bacterium]|nr:SDR family NAD(P)-dependent oxidoreductase [Gammaproteobacteria bacterium]